MKEIMPIRQKYVQDALQGFDSSHVYLVAKNEAGYYPAANFDDIGKSFLAQVSRFYLDTSFEQFIILFHAVFIGASFLLGCIGILLTIRHRVTQLISIGCLILLSIISYWLGDNYVLYFFSASFIPILYYLIQSQRNWTWFLSLVPIAFLANLSNLVRSNSGTTLMIFAIGLIIGSQQLLWKKRTFAFAMLAIGFFSFTLLKTQLIQQRDHFLAHHNYEKSLNSKHPFWHTIYIGLGFVGNQTVAYYADDVGFEKVNQIAPQVEGNSPEYERILKKEVLQFALNHPYDLAINVMAKLGVIFWYLLFFGGIGLIYTIKGRQFVFAAPYVLPVSYSIFIGVAAVPRPQYLMGLMAVLTFFSIYAWYNYHMLRASD